MAGSGGHGTAPSLEELGGDTDTGEQQRAQGFSLPEEVIINGSSDNGQLCDQVHAVLEGIFPVLAFVYTLANTLKLRPKLNKVATCSYALANLLSELRAAMADANWVMG